MESVDSLPEVEVPVLASVSQAKLGETQMKNKARILLKNAIDVSPEA